MKSIWYRGSVRYIGINTIIMKIHEITLLFEGYPQAQTAFIHQSGGDTTSVQKTIADFKQLVSRNQIKDVNQKNIDWWAKQGWDKFNVFVDQAAAIPSKTQMTRKKIPGQSINLVDDGQWLIVVPLDKEASCFHGRNSSWCTTKVHQEHFENYFYNNEVTLIYCFNKATGGMWAIAAHKRTDRMEMFTQQDASISAEKFTQLTGLDPQRLRSMALGDVHQPAVQASRDQWKESVALTKQLMATLPRGTRSAEIEKQLLYNKVGGLCFDYIYRLQSIESKDLPLSIQISAINKNGAVLDRINNPVQAVQLAAVKKENLGLKTIIERGAKPNEAVQLAAVTQHGPAIGFLKAADITPSEAVQMAAVNQSGTAIHSIISNGIVPSDEVQIAAVTQNPEAIKFIITDLKIAPSHAVQMAAVKRYGGTFRMLINHGIIPSRDVQEEAIARDGISIQYLENPNERLQLAAVKNAGRAILFILRAGIKPSHAVQLAAVTQDGLALDYILQDKIKPEYDVLLAAVTQDGRAIEYIQNPDERLQIAAAKRNSGALKLLMKAGISPSYAVQLASVTHDPWSIKYLKNPDERLQLAAVNNHGGALYEIIKSGIVPSEAVQLAAVRSSPAVLRTIQNPSMAVRDAAYIAAQEKKAQEDAAIDAARDARAAQGAQAVQA